MKDQKLIKFLEIAIKASIEAGKETLKIYNEGFDVEYKDDKSPLTIADKKSNDIINEYLTKTNIPILSEEGKSVPFKIRKDWKLFWIVDPLDGTKEFIKRNGEFTVNIALIKDGKPILGVIYIPVQKTLYFGTKETGSLKVDNIEETIKESSLDYYVSNGIRLPLDDKNKIFTIVGSKSYMTTETEDYIKSLKNEHGKIKVFSRGSSLKICMVAEGKADEYPRFAPTMEWDIAAGHAIVKYAGGQIRNYKTESELTYNNETLINSWFIVKRG